MAAKRILFMAALAVVVASTGCRNWCEHHYPCPAPAYAPAAYAPQQPCVPCCPPASGYAPAAAPAAVPAQAWSNPGGPPRTCSCTIN